MDVLLLRDKIAEAGNRYAASLNVDPTDDWIILKTLEEAGFSLVLAKRFDVDLLRALERKWHLPEGSLQ